MISKKEELNDWIYIYRIDKENRLIYDRTVSRYGLGLQRAKEVVNTWKIRGYEAFYTIGTLPRKEAYY